MAELEMHEFDCFRKRFATCPWCGYEDRDSWEYQEGETETECPWCGEPYTVETVLEVRYTTVPKGGWPDE